ncbi:MAG: hypothetical protein JWL81_2559 [Verrucomicrobiales bacterium]|nr:hypothetical protein [Verrucomicrobiales bacterium]
MRFRGAVGLFENIGFVQAIAENPDEESALAQGIEVAGETRFQTEAAEEKDVGDLDGGEIGGGGLPEVGVGLGGDEAADADGILADSRMRSAAWTVLVMTSRGFLGSR